MNYPPPWMDSTTLAEHICASPNTIDTWVLKGILPPPRKRGGKLMWKWIEVDEYLTNGGLSPDAEAERIRENVKRAVAESSADH